MIKSLHSNNTGINGALVFFFFRKVSINILMTKDKMVPGGEVFFLQHLDLEH